MCKKFLPVYNGTKLTSSSAMAERPRRRFRLTPNVNRQTELRSQGRASIAASRVKLIEIFQNYDHKRIATFFVSQCIQTHRHVVVSEHARENGEMFSITQETHTACILGAYGGRDENIQVNGYVFVCDMTGVGPKHLTRWSMDDMKKWNSCWQVHV